MLAGWLGWVVGGVAGCLPGRFLCSWRLIVAFEDLPPTCEPVEEGPLSPRHTHPRTPPLNTALAAAAACAAAGDSLSPPSAPHATCRRAADPLWPTAAGGVDHPASLLPLAASLVLPPTALASGGLVAGHPHRMEQQQRTHKQAHDARTQQQQQQLLLLQQQQAPQQQPPHPLSHPRPQRSAGHPLLTPPGAAPSLPGGGAPTEFRVTLRAPDGRSFSQVIPRSFLAAYPSDWPQVRSEVLDRVEG